MSNRIELRSVAAVALAFSASFASSSIAAGVACIPEDLDGSGVVDGADLGVLLAGWGERGGLGPADFDRSGAVDGADLGVLLAQWGDVPTSACVQVASVSPATGAVGDIVTITGTFPSGDALDYAVMVKAPSGTVVPFDVVGVTPTALTARVGPYPAGTEPGVVVIGLGVGNSVPSDRLPGGFTFTGNPWVWSSTGPSLVSTVAFTPTPAAAPIAGTFFGSIVKGGLQATLTGDCVADTTFRLWIRARHERTGASDPFMEAALYVPSAQLEQRQSQLDCVMALCSIINTVYLAQSPTPIVGDCVVEPMASSVAIGSYVDSVVVNSGAFVVQVLPR